MRRPDILFFWALLLWGVLLLTSCGGGRRPYVKPSQNKPKIQPVSFYALPWWQIDKGSPDAYRAFQRSCDVILKKNPNTAMGLGTTAAEWHQVCRIAKRHTFKTPQSVRHYFETNFIPYRVTDNGDPVGLFTGYYESSLKGSLQKTWRYKYPLYRKPPELLMDMNNQDRKWGVLKWGRIVPYHDRAAIDRGAISKRGLELVWVDDFIEAFFLHVQGSGRITLPDGKVMRVSYAASNGHPFRSIGQYLMENNIMDVKNISMQSIREWMSRDPKKALWLMHKNPSYVFFREIKGAIGPIGCMGVPVVPGRSMAIDKRWLPMGAPLWFDGFHPDNHINERRLMIAQDTGGAIRGVVRGDFFWGYGTSAMERAGKMRTKGQYYVLLPKNSRVHAQYLP